MATILDMEPTEIQEFSHHLQEAVEPPHVEPPNHQPREESLTTISLAISILAVLVSMVTVLGHRSHTAAVLEQARANDAWSEYQSKKIRVDNTLVAIDLLHLQPAANEAGVEAKIDEYRKHLERWNDELAEEHAHAQELEASGAHAEAQASRFDLGEALLQISVVLCSVTLFTRRRLYFYLGLAIGACGLVFAASALFVH